MDSVNTLHLAAYILGVPVLSRQEPVMLVFVACCCVRILLFI